MSPLLYAMYIDNLLQDRNNHDECADDGIHLHTLDSTTYAHVGSSYADNLLYLARAAAGPTFSGSLTIRDRTQGSSSTGRARQIRYDKTVEDELGSADGFLRNCPLCRPRRRRVAQRQALERR
jgi:hypothetical protein